MKREHSKGTVEGAGKQKSVFYCSKCKAESVTTKNSRTDDGSI